MKLSLTTILLLLLFIFGDLVRSLDFDGFANKCSSCIDLNPRYRYVCGVCTDDRNP